MHTYSSGICRFVMITPSVDTSITPLPNVWAEFFVYSARTLDPGIYLCTSCHLPRQEPLASQDTLF